MTTKRNHFTTTLKLLTKTFPYLALNAGIYAAFFVASVIWITVWLALAVLFAKINGFLALICIIIAFGVLGGVLRFARRYLLYMVKGGHIAALTHFLHGRLVPDGKGQLAYGKEVVQKQFLNMNLLFALDRLIDGTVRAFSNGIIRITDWLPLPGDAKNVVRWLTQILARSLTYVDEAILSYSIGRSDDNVWGSAQHGIILYAQAYKGILVTSLKVWLVGKVFSFLVFLIIAMPLALLFASFVSSGWVTFGLIIFAILMAMLAERALFEPFAMTYVLVTYHHEIEGLVPDPTWDARLSSVSRHFRDLAEKAKNFVSGNKGQPAAAAAAPGASGVDGGNDVDGGDANVGYP